MDFGALRAAEKPHQHIKEVNTDIGGQSAGTLDLPFPGDQIPGAAGGDVGEADVFLGLGLLFLDLLPQGLGSGRDDGI